MLRYDQRLRIWETNYGRDAGWVIERQGERIAILTDPRFEDMYWESYGMEIVADDELLRERMQTVEFWSRAESEGLVWRSRQFGMVANGAIPAWSPFPEPGRLNMRQLYLPIPEPLPWDRLVLWLSRRRQQQSPPKPEW